MLNVQIHLIHGVHQVNHLSEHFHQLLVFQIIVVVGLLIVQVIDTIELIMNVKCKVKVHHLVDLVICQVVLDLLIVMVIPLQIVVLKMEDDFKLNKKKLKKKLNIHNPNFLFWIS